MGQAFKVRELLQVLAAPARPRMPSRAEPARAQELDIPRSSLVVSTKIFWGGKGVNDRGLSRKVLPLYA